MPDISPIGHALVCVSAQCLIGITLGDWATGGMAGSIWFFAREHTQAEYRWISLFGSGKRANMPWWGGFYWRVWNVASLLDWLVPMLACAIVNILAK